MNKQTYNDMDETIYTETLDNGLTVFLLPKQEMSKTYGVFSTDYGSIDQRFVPIKENETTTVPEGIAHFLEHKLFEKEDRDVFADFAKQAASPNAFTSFTKTAYLFAATNHIEKNVETLIDFVQDPYFSEESVEKEKGIIAQEINMFDDEPDSQSFMGTIKAMFEKHPVNIDIAGTVKSINTITKDDLYTCYNTFYHPANMTLFIAGNFDAESMMNLIQTNQQSKEFEEMDTIERELPDEPAEVAKKENKISMPVSIPKCTVGIKESSSELKGEAFLKKDLLQSMIMDHYFSKGGSFYQKLYSENLIDGSFYFETNLEKSFGYSLIGSNTENPDDFAEKVKALLKSTASDSLSSEEFERMKKKKVGQLLRAMNSLEFIANKYVDYHTLDIDLFDVLPTLQAITLDEVNDFLQDWIKEDRLAVCKIAAE
ncbi:putative Zn-dependent peptidase [Virgibacillus natechei]|uniref:Zn-dependent peptidase n=1 Tax=Virgibacillus natechei TaxID=1216297 RepID=A0ABS4IAS9_9BACI|nr:pitrilysin family protein [Virgibacillus natechei]MBP1968039.1 putative Zn-dependent peptidase [Virgibacillus natechei]UZD14679.1 insulinase family protein [Virgibacillus natechei]